MILLDGNSGKVEKIDAFDTWLSNEESTRMVKLLKSVGNYKIIVGSVLDDSLKHLSKELLASIVSYLIWASFAVFCPPNYIYIGNQTTLFWGQGAPQGVMLNMFSKVVDISAISQACNKVI